MIFAEIDYPESYAEMHSAIVRLMEGRFSRVQSGLQGDSWIWIAGASEKVSIDTFSSMKHQVKSRAAGPHVVKVIDALRAKFDVRVFDVPISEWD